VNVSTLLITSPGVLSDALLSAVTKLTGVGITTVAQALPAGIPSPLNLTVSCITPLFIAGNPTQNTIYMQCLPNGTWAGQAICSWGKNK
jgi:hypothetical protein